MTAHISVEIDCTGDGEPVLAAFFHSTGDIEVKQRTVTVRGEPDLVQIILLIVGEWAAIRYVLDPLADKFPEWNQAATSLQGKQFRISVQFQEGRLHKIETERLSSPLIIGNLWRTIRSASDLLAANMEELNLNRVLIVPGNQEEPLVIGYQGLRPSHILDISAGTILPIGKYDGRSRNELEQFLSGGGL